MVLKKVNSLDSLSKIIPALAKENSQEAWNSFVKITGNDLHRYICFLLHDTEHASDILQEVYILFLRDKKIFIKISHQESEENFSKKVYAWLYKTARNKSFDLIKKKKIGNKVNSIILKQVPPKEPSMPTYFLEEKETNELIKYELSMLSEKQQNLLTLKYFHDKSNLEIAPEINCEVISVPKLIDRALVQLKKRLEKAGISLSIIIIGHSLSNKAMCIDIPANILPEVFQLYNTAQVSGMLTKTSTIKGILMKTLYLISGAIAICTLLLYSQLPTQENPSEEITKKSTQTKQVTKNPTKEATKSQEITNETKPLDLAIAENAEISKKTVKTYQIENPVISFRINSISQLKEDYKKSPYFQFANSPATGKDFD